MPIEVALAGDGPLTAQVEHSERAHLAGVRDADRHSELLLHGWIRTRSVPSWPNSIGGVFRGSPGGSAAVAAAAAAYSA